MVIKGSSRAAPGELAYHLLREDTNEVARVVELSGVAARSLPDALEQLDRMGRVSRSGRTLYHASINTPVHEALTPDQVRRARERLAEEMGLTGQPYALVEHVKAGRPHWHIVWSRIDQATGKAIPDGHNYRRHETVARELEQEFSHERVIGAHTRDKAREARPERGPTWGELRQAERSGMTPQEARRIVSACWHETATAHQFRDRLEAEGFALARGDRRDYVLIDQAGEVHGVTRRIEGARAKEVRERLAELDAGELPDVAEARRQLRDRQRQQDQAPALGFVSAVDRLRAEDEARERNRPQLASTDQDVADALWKLNQTMRGQLAGIVKGNPEDRRQQDRQTDELARLAQANAAAEIARLTRPQPRESQKEPATLVAGASLDPTERASVKVENRNPVPQPRTGPEPQRDPQRRPSAVILPEQRQQQPDRLAQPPRPPEPVRNPVRTDRTPPAAPAPPIRPQPRDLLDEARQRLAHRTPEQIAQAREALRQLREQEERERVARERHHKPGD